MVTLTFLLLLCLQALGVDAQADLALAFMMVHEVPDQRRLLGEIQACLKPGGNLLLAEPKIHVPGKAFHKTVATAEELGLQAHLESRPPVETSRIFIGERGPLTDRGVRALTESLEIP
jgi:SAM-dependent methyltransferase